MSVKEITAGMRRAETRLATLATQLGAEDLGKTCYEGGWTVRDCLCHVSAHGQSMLRWMKEGGLPAAPDEGIIALRKSFAGPNGFDLHAFNDAVVAQRRSLPVQELAEVLRRDHEKVAAFLSTASPADLERPLTGAAWSTVGAALSHLANVENEHLDDVEAALRRREKA